MREVARKEGNIRWLGYLKREKKGCETGGVGVQRGSHVKHAKHESKHFLKLAKCRIQQASTSHIEMCGNYNHLSLCRT